MKYKDPSGHVFLDPWYEYMAGPKTFRTWLCEDVAEYNDDAGRKWKNIGNNINLMDFINPNKSVFLMKLKEDTEFDAYIKMLNEKYPDLKLDEDMVWGFNGKGEGFVSENSKNNYGRPLSDMLWLISASSSFTKVYNEEKSIIEFTLRQSTVSPKHIDLNTGKITWVNPKYAKNMKWAGFLGYAGDVANIAGVSINIFHGDGLTIENTSDLIFGVIGFFPVSGDFCVLIYESMKWQIKNPDDAFRRQLMLKH